MISDPSLFLQKIMEQAIAKSPNLGATLITQDKNASEAYMAEVLGDRLAAIFETNESNESDRGGDSDMNLSPEFLAEYEELVERNGVLAAALGACDCWGDHADCEVCHGAGRPGWTFPDKQLFAHFVRPALNAVSKLRASRGGAGMEVRRQMNGEPR